MPLAIFGIENTALNLAVTFAILCLVAIWLALIVFTFTDARRRISDPFLIGCATAASLFPFVGTIVYTILRPAEFLADAHERDVEVRTSEVRLRHLEEHSCHKCGFPTESEFMRCPSCRTRLKEECPTCSKPVGMDWKLCPYCETALVAPPKRSRSSSKPSSGSKERRREQPTGEEPKASGRRSSKSTSSRSSSSRSAEKSTSRSGSGSSSKPSPSRPKSSSSARSDETVESAAARPSPDSDTTKSSGSSRRTPRSTRRKPINAGDDGSNAKPINSGDAPAPSRTPESR